MSEKNVNICVKNKSKKYHLKVYYKNTETETCKTLPLGKMLQNLKWRLHYQLATCHRQAETLANTQIISSLSVDENITKKNTLGKKKRKKEDTFRNLYLFWD